MAEASAADFQTLLRLLRDRTLGPVVEEAVLHYVDRQEVLERPPLPGLTHEETWELLEGVRRIAAIGVPVPPSQERTFWYGLTLEGRRCLDQIRRHCRDESPMNLMLRERRGGRALVDVRIRETVACCRLDGLLFDEAAADEMLRTRRRPGNATERLITNAFELASELESLASEAITPELPHELSRRIESGVDSRELSYAPPKTGFGTTSERDSVNAADLLQSICDYANGKTGDPWEPTVCRAYLVFSAMTYWRPLSALNSLVGRALMLLVCIKNGYSGLVYVPTSHMLCRWLDGQIPSGTLRFHNPRRYALNGDAVDGSPDILSFLQLTTWAIDELLKRVGGEQQREDGLLRSLDLNEHFNQRQRSVLVDALRDPGAEFRITQHQTRYRVVYQTARTDLLDLVEHGYLTVGTVGKAFVFKASDDLQARLSDLRRG